MISSNNEIKRIRKYALLSQVEFAKEIGVSFATVNRWEQGRTAPSNKAIKSIVAFCDKKNIDFNLLNLINEKSI